MKRLLSCGVLVLALAGCGSSSGTTGAQGSPSADPSGAQQSSEPGSGSALTACINAPATAPAPAGATTDLKVEPKVAKPTGPAPCALQTRDIVTGKGTPAKPGSMVAVKYVGVLYQDGTVFDASWKTSASTTLPFTIGAMGVIAGFDKGTQGMRVGGRREIIIPSKDGYGDAGSPPVIPPSADLIFVVDLVKVS